MRPAHELLTLVRARAAGTPCVVQQTPDGFDVRLDLDDPRWHSQIRGWGLSETVTQHVRTVESDRCLTITQERRPLVWVTDLDGVERPTSGSVDAGGDAQTRPASIGRDLVVDAAGVLGWAVDAGDHRAFNRRVAAVALTLAVLSTVLLLVVARATAFA